MSGFGSWHPQRQGERASRWKLSIVLSLVLLVVALACGSQAPAATPTPEPTATPSPVPRSAPLAPASAPLSLPPDLQGALPNLSEVIEKVRPSVAAISVQSVSRGLFFDFTDEGAGTGIVVRADGYIVTNFHVVQNTNEIRVHLPNGKTYSASVVGRDMVTDLAVLKIDAQDLPTAVFGNSDTVRVGDWVIALGNALALKGGPTVTLGIISARGRTINTERGQLYDMIQTDAAINDGNSGGPLVNLSGEVIGINTAILRQAQGIGFAVSASVAKPIIESLIQYGRVRRPLIGLTGDDVTPARANQLNLPVTEGVIVTHAVPNGPAYKAGIRVGDVITRVNDIPTQDLASFLLLLWTFNVGDKIQVEYISNGQTNVATVELAERVD